MEINTAPKQNKYRNKKTEVDGIKFASMAEAKRYRELRLLERAGEIRTLIMQPSFVIQDAFTSNQGLRISAIRYVADFEYFDNKTGETIVEDVKGVKTDVFLIKMKMFLKRYQQYKFVIV